MDFSGGSDGKASTYNAGDLGSPPELGRSPGGGHGNPLQYSCLENPYGQRSLVGYSPCGDKESNTAKRPSTARSHSNIIKTVSWGLKWYIPLFSIICKIRVLQLVSSCKNIIFKVWKKSTHRNKNMFAVIRLDCSSKYEILLMRD